MCACLFLDPISHYLQTHTRPFLILYNYQVVLQKWCFCFPIWISSFPHCTSSTPPQENHLLLQPDSPCLLPLAFVTISFISCFSLSTSSSLDVFLLPLFLAHASLPQSHFSCSCLYCLFPLSDPLIHFSFPYLLLLLLMLVLFYMARSLFTSSLRF